jgi:pyruvate dehydrogenase E1 component subunit alpha
MITAYREHGFQLCRGDTPESVFGELLGKATGCSKGNGGSMHMFHPEGNFHGGNGIVGAQVPIGAGIAFALKHQKTDNVCMAYYGDGAANQGQLFEAYNMAVLWDLPVLFVCENNKYGMGTSIERAAAGLKFYERGHYIPGMWIDGMDVLAVRNGVEFAAKRAREGLGPMILEMETYRYVGHSMSDPGTTYRTRSEVDQVRKTRDPIELVKSRILQSNVATAEEIKAIEKDIRQRILDAANTAKAASDPPPQQLYENITTDSIPVRAVEFHNSYVPK